MMRRTHLLFFVLMSACGGSQRDAAQKNELNVARVVLYQNGVGYIEQRGEIDRDKLTLRIMPDQIADILKTLTVIDLGSGRPVNVTLPVEKTRLRRLADLPEQVRNGGGLRAVAEAFRGAEVDISAKDGHATGRLTGVETIDSSADEEHPKITYRVAVLTDDGTIQSFPLEDIEAMHIKDKTLELGLRKALDVALDQGSWKPVELTIYLAGPKPHNIAVSYVVEMPRWKPAYRVVLKKGGRRGLLQGWAIVDNVSGADWDEVFLSLTAGTPLTFRYDLYSPKYVTRPDLTPQGEEVALAPPPATEGAAVDEVEEREEAQSAVGVVSKDMRAGGAAPSMKRAAPMASKARESLQASGLADAGGGPEKSISRLAQPITSEQIQRNFKTLVSGSQVGSLFRYDLKDPVTIRDKQSALVALLNKELPAESIFLYRIDSSEKHPYRAVRLTNDSGFAIEQGPMAIYQEGSFVGEAVGGRIEVGTSTFIPYALEGGMLVSLEEQVKDASAELLTIANGVVTCETKRVSLFKYTIQRQVDDARHDKVNVLYLQRQQRTDWHIVDPPKGVLREKDYYFVPVKLGAKKENGF